MNLLNRIVVDAAIVIWIIKSHLIAIMPSKLYHLKNASMVVAPALVPFTHF